MSKKPLFLLSNDDGVHAPGIKVLAKSVALFGDVVIAAPHTEKSATSQSITIHTPLRYEQLEDNVFAIEGTPADCILFACRQLLDRKPDWVISGINRGANLGTDTMYSGTVGAALEGVLQGCKAIAVSSHGPNTDELNYESAALIVQKILENHNKISHDFEGVLNINVPSIAYDDIKGIRPAVLGRRNYEQHFVKGVDPRGKDYYWIGGESHGYEDIPNSDCEIIEQNYATLTYLKPSLFEAAGHDKICTELSSLLS